MSVISGNKATSTGGARTRPGALAESGSPTVRPPAAAHLSDEQVAELGRELDAIRDEILAKRG
ncbi:MAG TPA: acyl-CoA desaturase, partial [Arthrobacter sp.]|nr:acyl-CoA desaturase [Arthrobacter sp.]